MTRWPVGRLVLALLLLAINLFALGWSFTLWTVPSYGWALSSLELEPPCTSARYMDGRRYDVVFNLYTGQSTWTKTRRGTWEGFGKVIWPIPVALLFSGSVVWFVRRNAAGRLLQFGRLRRLTIQGLISIVAIVAGECWLTLQWFTWIRRDLPLVDWPVTLLAVAALNLLAVIPLGILLSYIIKPELQKEETVRT